MLTDKVIASENIAVTKKEDLERIKLVSYPKTYKRKNKVVIVGSASRTLEEAPYDDNEFEIWGLAWRNDKELDRFHRIFDMHPISETRKNLPKNYVELLNKRNEKIPLIIGLPDLRLLNATLYPLEDVIKFFMHISNTNDPEYFAKAFFMSSIAYMFSLAMFESYEEIQIYGVDLINEDEYFFQKSNIEYLIGLARGCGFKVKVPKKSALVKGTHVYGYDPHPGDGTDGLTIEVLEEELQKTKRKHQEAMQFLFTADGAMQTLEKQILYKKNFRKGIKMDYSVEAK